MLFPEKPKKKRLLTIMKENLKMFLWESIFILFILPWFWLPCVLGIWDQYEKCPYWLRWVIDRCNGDSPNFRQ